MLTIREIGKEDLQEYVAMASALYSSPACMHEISTKNFTDTFQEVFRSKERAGLFLIEDETGTVGYILLAFTWSAEAGGLTVWIEELYFKEQARGKGYGSQVFAWIEDTYSQAKRFRLEAARSNERAIALYERLGYEELPYYQMIKDRKENSQTGQREE